MDDQPVDRLPHSWSGLLVAVVALALAAMGALVLLVLYLQARPLDLRARTLAATDAAEKALIQGSVPKARIERSEEETRHDARAIWNTSKLKVDLPPNVSPGGVQRLLEKTLAPDDAIVTNDAGTLHLTLAGREFAVIQMTLPPPAPAAGPATPSPPAPQPVPAVATPSPLAPQPAPTAEAVSPATPQSVPKAQASAAPVTGGARPKVAIIVDDGGYGGEPTKAILAMDPGLTLSILPDTPFGTSIAKRAEALGFEVMLHMPMQALKSQGRALHPLTVNMSARQIAAITAADLAQVPGAVGVNNHEGSRFTGNTIGMTRFLRCIKKRHLYFVDSLTTPLSVGTRVARSLGIPAAVRNVFLDDESRASYIRGQFALLVAQARKDGRAIGICHFRRETVRVLPGLLKDLREKEGMDLVHVSELVR